VPSSRLALLLLTAFAGAALAAACQASNPSPPTAAEAAVPSPSTAGPSPAPPFELVDMRGRKVALAQFSARPVVLLFCVSWLPPCRSEMSRFQEAYGMHARAGLVILGIEERDSRAEVEALARELGLTFPLLLDDGQRVYDLFGVQGVPTTVFLDRRGGVRYRQVGALDEETLSRALNLIVR
jgi:peroxiredoxin